MKYWNEMIHLVIIFGALLKTDKFSYNITFHFFSKNGSVLGRMDRSLAELLKWHGRI
jgi:hypothetical protein